MSKCAAPGLGTFCPVEVKRDGGLSSHLKFDPLRPHTSNERKVDSSTGFLLHCAKRGASKRQIMPFRTLHNCGHVFGNSKLPGGHFGEELFESARSEDYQMARRDAAYYAERVFFSSRDKNRSAGTSREPVAIETKFAFARQDDEGLVRVVVDV